MKTILKYFVDPKLPPHQEAERQRITNFRYYLAIIFALYLLALVLELVFDFRSFNWFSFVSTLLATAFFMGLSLTPMPHKYLLTIYFTFILFWNELQFIPRPQSFHVAVFWIGISPLYVAVLAKPKTTLVWTIIFILSLVIHGLYIGQTVGAYEITLNPNRFLVAGILFMLTTSLLAAFFSYTQLKMRRKLDRQNFELVELTKQIEERNTQLKNYNEHLEERVSERTEELEHQNKQLTEYAFINSHLLRAPLASILGIINLLKGTKLTDDQREYVEHLSQSSTNLDEVVGKINKALDIGGKFNRETLKKLKEENKS